MSALSLHEAQQHLYRSLPTPVPRLTPQAITEVERYRLLLERTDFPPPKILRHSPSRLREAYFLAITSIQSHLHPEALSTLLNFIQRENYHNQYDVRLAQETDQIPPDEMESLSQQLMSILHPIQAFNTYFHHPEYLGESHQPVIANLTHVIANRLYKIYAITPMAQPNYKSAGFLIGRHPNVYRLEVNRHQESNSTD